MGIYEFKREDAEQFARAQGIRTRIKNGSRELEFETCPACRARRDRWTFSINLQNGRCHCFRASCGYHGNMVTLARDFGFELSENVKRYYNINNCNSKFKSFKDGKRKIETRNPAIKYLAKRGISEETAKRFEVTSKKDDENVLVFAFKNEDGEIKLIKYRNMTFEKGKSQGRKEWCESNCMPILYGMDKCNPENKTLVLTEGQIDSLSCAEAGIENAVSVPTGANGFTWIPYCWNWVNRFEEIIVFGDHEKGHITLFDEIQRQFKRLKVKHVQESDYKDCKDANEILQRYGKDQIVKCVQDAVLPPMKQIIDAGNVDMSHIPECERIETLIPSLDRMLRGGIPKGGLTLVTGKAGEGKSTFASWLVAAALEKGHKVFCYSGELSVYMFLDWLHQQLAGDRNVTKEKDRWNNQRYFIPQKIVDRMQEWYQGRLYLYDNAYCGDDAPETLLQITEKMIRQHGTDVVLIDNIMTALDLEPSKNNDRYERQSLFCKQLARIAIENNAAIIVVAHKRKNNSNQNENDEIMGSSDIANLGFLTLSFGKGNSKKCQPDQRILSIAKDRYYGVPRNNEIVMNYEESTRRVYAEKDSLDYSFGWNRDKEGFESAFDNPFEQMKLEL